MRRSPGAPPGFRPDSYRPLGTQSAAICRSAARQRLIHGSANCVELVVSRHLLDQMAAAVVIEDDEVPHQGQEALGAADALQEDLQLREGCSQPSPRPVMVRQGLNHSLPAVRVPMRAARPSETIKASFMENRPGSSAL